MLSKLVNIFPLLLLSLFFNGITVSAGEFNAKHKNNILFICTGNYYRSRFAEALFNFFRDQAPSGRIKDWHAISRGLDLAALTTEQKMSDVSPITAQELTRLQIPLSYAPGKPTALAIQDLEESSYVVLMNQSEHEPLLKHQFPQADFSKIHDLAIPDSKHLETPAALSLIKNRVAELLQQLET